MNCYQRLANTIILQAVKDYRSYKKALARRPNSNLAQAKVSKCEKFFLSDWFKVLTNVDGTFVLKRLEAEEQ